MQVNMNTIMPMTRKAFEALHQMFADNGYSLFMAGGAVRDIIQKKFPSDIDFTTNANPQAMIAMVEKQTFWKIFATGIDHGTMTFMSLFGTFEITTMRKDIETDGRHAIVEFTNNLYEDGKRRDFTINAMFMDIEGKVYDFFGGLTDIEKNHLRFVGDPAERINEDALRIMRFLRFVTTNEMNFSPSTFKAVSDKAYMLRGVSVERIWSEISKASFKAPHRMSKFFFLMYMSGAMEVLKIPGMMPFDHLNRVACTNENVSKGAGVFPAFYIGALATPKEAEEFADRFHISSFEKDEMIWFATEKDRKFEELTRGLCEDWINEGVQRSWIKHLASYFNNGDLEDSIDMIPRTVFPVKGQDILDNFDIEPGPQVGAIVRRMKDDWKQSRYTFTKDDLITNFKGKQNA